MNGGRMQVLQDRFRAKCRDDRAALTAIAARTDAASLEALEWTAHRIAGAAGTFGYPSLSAAASRVETLIVEGETEDAAFQAARDALAEALGRVGEDSSPG